MKYELTEKDRKKISKRMKKTRNVVIYKRLQAVKLRTEGRQNKEISEITGYSENYVGQLVKEYVLFGLNRLASDGRKGGNHKNLSFEKETEILKEFLDRAIIGQIITVGEIKKRYDEVLGRETKPSFIYSVLKRHEWRKVMPRGAHPKKASVEEIEATKKLNLK